MIGTPFGPDWPGQRCGARCKRTGKPCQGPAMANGRCRMHGGKSTGPKTAEGRQRISKAHLKHGDYSRAGKAALKRVKELELVARRLGLLEEG